MQILKDIMTPDVEIITPHATVQEAALMMKDLKCGGHSCL